MKSLSYDSNPLRDSVWNGMWTSMFGFKNDTKRSQIHYEGDSCLGRQDYFRQCFDSNGDFLMLGNLGVNNGN